MRLSPEVQLPQNPDTPYARELVFQLKSILRALIQKLNALDDRQTHPIAFSAYAGSTQSVTSGVATKVQINTETFDSGSCFDSTTNYRFTPTVAGYYQVNGVVRITATTFRTDYAEMWKNGAVYARGEELTQAASATCQVVVSEVVYLNGTTDYLELYGFSNGTSPQFLASVASATSRFSAALIAAA